MSKRRKIIIALVAIIAIIALLLFWVTRGDTRRTGRGRRNGDRSHPGRSGRANRADGRHRETGRLGGWGRTDRARRDAGGAVCRRAEPSARAAHFAQWRRAGDVDRLARERGRRHHRMDYRSADVAGRGQRAARQSGGAAARCGRRWPRGTAHRTAAGRSQLAIGHGLERRHSVCRESRCRAGVRLCAGHDADHRRAAQADGFAAGRRALDAQPRTQPGRHAPVYRRRFGVQHR